MTYREKKDLHYDPFQVIAYPFSIRNNFFFNFKIIVMAIVISYKTDVSSIFSCH
jgi:hypothetical protein